MKHVIVVFLMLVTVSLSAQNKQNKQNKANKCYVETAVSTFNLSEENKAKLNEALEERLNEKRVLNREARANALSKDDKRTKARAINQKYFTTVAKLTGKSKKEIMTFEKATKKSCRK